MQITEFEEFASINIEIQIKTCLHWHWVALVQIHKNFKILLKTSI